MNELSSSDVYGTNPTLSGKLPVNASATRLMY
uniref:Uncharacterized protein n=1 Tax=viral metagenome TaxID=1070528 RepID=A0A6C0BKV1_9ZZZZ